MEPARIFSSCSSHTEISSPRSSSRRMRNFRAFSDWIRRGLHLELQLVNLIVDAHQILLGALQLALGLLLPVAVAGDAGGLLKDLPAVGGLDGQDLVNFALADDGVALPAQARCP